MTDTKQPEPKITIREDGTRLFNGMPDYEFLKIEQLRRIADALEGTAEALGRRELSKEILSLISPETYTNKDLMFETMAQIEEKLGEHSDN